MRKISCPKFLSFLATCCLIPGILISCAKITPKTQVQSLSETSVHAYNIPKVEAQELNLVNGMKIVFGQNDELPLVSGAIYFKGGSLWEDVAKIGTVSVMGGQIRQGGAGDLDPDELDLALETRSAKISSGFGAEYGSVSFDCLSSDLEAVFALFADVVQRPGFDEKRLEIWRGQALDSIKRRVDDPITVASLSLRELLFAKDPYGRVSTSDDVRRVNRADIIKAYERLVQPSGATLVISGKVDKAKMFELVQKYFAPWQSTAPGQSQLPPKVDTVPSPAVYFIELPLEQATVYIGQQGVERLSPDYLAIDVFNQIFGASSFGSMLTQKIRSEKGLAYSVYGGIIPGVVKGQNIMALQTKAASVDEAVVGTLKVLQELKEQGASLDRLNEAKVSIQNSFVFNFDSVSGVLNRQVVQGIIGYPSDFDSTYLGGIRSVKEDEVLKVARNRWDMKKLVLVVVGNKEVGERLQSLLNKENGVLAGYKLRQVKFDEKLRVE